MKIEQQITVLEELGIKTSKEMKEKINKKIINKEYGDAEKYPFFELISDISDAYWNYDTMTYCFVSNQIFTFDAEFPNLDNMYEQFMQGLLSITKDELDIKEIKQETIINETGDDGSIVLSFTLNGREYRYNCLYERDWLDAGVFGFLESVMMKEKEDKYFYTLRNGQGCSVFSCSKDWAIKFHEATGLKLSTTN